MNLSQWVSIIDSLPELEVIETKWIQTHGRDSIAGLMVANTGLKKIILSPFYEYDALRTIIDRECNLKRDSILVIHKSILVKNTTQSQMTE